MSLPDSPRPPAFRQAFTRVFPRNSNTHWLNIASMLADAAFETDQAGRFTAFGQVTVLGIPATQLIGQHIGELFTLAGGSAANSFTAIFAALDRQSLVWRGAVSLPHAAGSYQIFLAPKPADSPGAYGMLIDMQGPELQPLAANDLAAGMLDPQTGLWSADAFQEEFSRRFDRLDVEGLPGTLLLLGFGRTPAIGHKAVAIRLAQELRDVSRPTDILGRINATTFGLWCDGMDDLTGAERAARFCQRLPAALPGNPCICVGLVARWPGNMEDPQALIRQASTALQHAERVSQGAADAGTADAAARGTWRVWNARAE